MNYDNSDEIQLKVLKSFQIAFGELNYLESILFEETIAHIDFTQYQDARIVIKGSSGKVIPVSAYVKLTEKLQSFVKAMMYGEACSTVPLWKKGRD